jgi:hypothetical protein
MKNLQLNSCARIKMFFIKTRKMSDVVRRKKCFYFAVLPLYLRREKMFRW